MGKVMVIDDNPTNLKLAVDVLQCEGLDVLRARSAENALKILETEVPAVILVDIQMPGMDGLSLTRLLKADARFQNTAIVALTAFAMKGDDEKARQAGCDAYITKPIDTRKFGGMVTQLIQSRVKP